MLLVLDAKVDLQVVKIRFFIEAGGVMQSPAGNLLSEVPNGALNQLSLVARLKLNLFGLIFLLLGGAHLEESLVIRIVVLEVGQRIVIATEGMGEPRPKGYAIRILEVLERLQADLVVEDADELLDALVDFEGSDPVHHSH